MALTNENPLTNLIARGLILSEPAFPLENNTVLNIDLDHLATRLKARIKLFLPYNGSLRDKVRGSSEAAITNAIQASIDEMIDAALLITYNRLRGVLDRYAPAIRTVNMNTRAAIDNKMEFPTFLSSLLSSIGPLYTNDGPRDMMIVYSTAAARANSYGRTVTPTFRVGALRTFLNNLGKSGVPMSSIDFNNDSGSFFSTIIPVTHHNRWTFTGWCHASHYENNDILRSWLAVHPDVNSRAFEYGAITIGEFTTAAGITSIAGTQPPGAAQDLTSATSPTCPIGGMFNVNYYGIRPAVTATSTVTASPAAAYIIGRGNEQYFTVQLARSIAESDMIAWASWAFHNKD